MNEKVRGSSPLPLAELQWQMLPWLIPLVIAGSICYFFDLKSPENFLVLIPMGVIALFGMTFVGWAFMVEGPIADYKTAKGSTDD
ncbi:MAG: hypothetical protein ACTHJU_10165 [Sphingopyxis sp.]